jgi:cephalosporin-C deacetylase-like acetyl esterase
MNTWDPENASCTVPEDNYDPHKESTLEYSASIESDSAKNSYKIGDWSDVYCVRNNLFYEAQVKKIKIPKKETEKKRLLFHFKGWGDRFDEWLEVDSERIHLHNLYTSAAISDPRLQEAWQGE